MRCSNAAVPLAGAALVAMLASCSGAQPQAGTPGTAPPSQGAPATKSTAASATSTADQLASCVLTPAEVKESFAEWIGPGDVAISLEDTADFTCRYQVSEGSFNLGGAGIVVERTAYDDPELRGTKVYNVSATWGGGTPEEVFSSTTAAWKKLASADGRGAPITPHPEIGGGAVFNGETQIVVAPRADYWYSVTITAKKPNPKYEGSLVAAAKAIDKKVSSGS